MEKNERHDGNLTIDRDAQIQVVVNNTAKDEDTINLGRVFHTMGLKWRIYAWVLVLCVVAGACIPLVSYQFTRQMASVSSVVTLKYDVAMVNELDGTVTLTPVADLTAPDGSALDLNQITSSYVLQNALGGLDLSQNVSLANLRKNIVIERILSEESRRQQEVAASMVEVKNNGAYAAVQELDLKYENTFVVTLTNGFGDEGEPKVELTDTELRLVLDRVLAAYNDYLMTAYAPIRQPDDEISAIDVENVDLLESLDQLRTAVQDLAAYCDANTDAIKAYRSWRTGRSLTDWMETLETVRQVDVEYLYSFVYTNSIVRDKDTMITNYQYQLRDTQTKLDVVNENIETVSQILTQYKNDEIYVSMQESDAAKSTRTTTDYYNQLVLQQAKNYERAERLEARLADLNSKIESLNANDTDAERQQEAIEEAQGELNDAMEASHAVYDAICDHMAEIMEQPFYTTYADHSAATGKEQSFLRASMKPMIVGIVVGAAIACLMWLLSGLAPEFRRRREDEAPGAAGAASASGEEAAKE